MTSSISETLRRVKFVLMKRGIGPEDAEDAVQEAFQKLEAYRQAHEVHSPEGFLVRAAINLALDGIRKRNRTKIVDEPVENFNIVDNSPRPDEVYAARQRLQRLNAGFAELDSTTRQMLTVQRMEGLSVAAIAKRHGVSVSAVEKRLAKGIAFLVSWMKEW